MEIQRKAKLKKKGGEGEGGKYNFVETVVSRVSSLQERKGFKITRVCKKIFFFLY